MDLEYDRKFEDMKKYIPFLESMIKRLESTSTASANPRQAQLDKIRSLRDLLLDKKKRMKMENLLKCEQVLVNLYAKVEQRDSLSGIKKLNEDSVFSIDSPTPKEKSDLEAVRNKFKTVKKQDGIDDTLPEIARASEVEEVCTPGSKEPALFQRRPNKSSISPSRHSPNKSKEDASKALQTSSTKRNYTRVLVSPEPSPRHWSPSGKTDDKPFLIRRSPRRSPRRLSPSNHKKERKKFSKESYSRKSKDFNITLNVPEDSLHSLNTKDILSRIINCSDGDVDIDTLRELRKQILGELKNTGSSNDISDLILKSYNKKHQFVKKSEEVEEGEISDSENEAIESMCGSLIVKEQNVCAQTISLKDKDNQPRKIQICLVINSDKDNDTGSSTNKVTKLNKVVESSDIEIYNKMKSDKNKESDVITIDDDEEDKFRKSNSTNGSTKNDSTIKNIEEIVHQVSKDMTLQSKAETQKVTEQIGGSRLTESQTKKHTDSTEILQKSALHKNSVLPRSNLISIEPQLMETSSSESLLPKRHKDSEPETPTQASIRFKANFYKPLLEHDNSGSAVTDKPTNTDSNENTVVKIHTNSVETVSDKAPVKLSTIKNNLQEMENPVEIPLLNDSTAPQNPETNTVSEIDILQALKNDILSESLAIPGSEASTPALHQPKVIKVVNAQEILPKKRISIEKYKEKSVAGPKTPLYINEASNSSNDEYSKKPSLKLTDKECERFNFPKTSFDDEDSSEEEGEDKNEYSLDDIYADLAPKSPDHDESSNIESTPPVLIPVERIKVAPVNNKSDIDMRTLPSASPSAASIPSLFSKVIMPPSKDIVFDNMVKNDTKSNNKSKSSIFYDPRVRRDQSISKESPNSHGVNPDRTPRSFNSGTLNVVPNMTPISTPNARSYEMTPSHQSVDLEQSNQKHVYAPSFSMFEANDRDKSITREMRSWDYPDYKGERRTRFDDVRDPNRKWDDRNPRNNAGQRDAQNSRYSDSFNYNKYGLRNDRFTLDRREDHSFNRSECPQTPLPSFGRSETPQFGRLEAPMTPIHPFGRGDCPMTPSHSFGRNDCPTTPIHPFGRSDCPTTPSHPFGRSDCTTTPSHLFGRSDCPTTPSHPFGRSDCPTTPSHPFGRSDCPTTPSHPFGRSESTPCPMTPSHPFGRSDIVSSGRAFGRPEFNGQKFNKDPRLNRKTEYESSPQYDEKDRDYYKERSFNRGGSCKSVNKSYSGQDSHRNYDREHFAGKSDKYRYYVPDQGGQQLSREHARYESNRSSCRDYENERSYNRDRSARYDDESKSHEVIGRSYQRERSVGKSIRPDDEKNIRSISRAPSVGRNIPKASENTLSVTPLVGRSFTIDTSVNSTFLNFIETKGIQVFDYSNFDVRRQRASSVGRSLIRESSVGRSSAVPSKLKNNDYERKREMFRRASSVGRDIAVVKNERSFQEVKADFEIYRTNVTQVQDITESIRSRKDNYEKQKVEKRDQSSTKLAYSPRKNSRDPRMRNMSYNDTKSYREDKIKYNRDPRYRTSGIDYSNENIAKGTILGSGSAVRNYKIPKIKRPVEEVEPVKESNKKEIGKTKEKEVEKEKETSQSIIKEKEIVKVTEKDKDKELQEGKGSQKLKPVDKVIPKQTKVKENEKKTDSKLNIPTEQSETQSDDIATTILDENSERRLTRSRTKGLGGSKTETSPAGLRTKKIKQLVLHDSDSDSDNSFIGKKNEIKLSKTEESPSPIKEKKLSKTQSDDVDLDSSFGIDEMFSDNAVTDPVIDNINALIADLDNDIDTSKGDTSDNFTKEITLENMLESITSPDRDYSNSSNEDLLEKSSHTDTNKLDEQVVVQPSLTEKVERVIDYNEANNISNVNETDSNKNGTVVTSVAETCETLQNENTLESNTLNQCNSSLHEQNEVESKENEIKNIDTEKVPDLSQFRKENIVSTTEANTKIATDKPKLTEQDVDSPSTPDSTINTDEHVVEKLDKHERLPDSTNEDHNETNVTSTESVSKDIEESNSFCKQSDPALDSIGSLLSFLQDKSKIKEVLNMLGSNSNDNEKIKKKLEKLSKIMSDEDELNDDELSKNEPNTNEPTVTVENPLEENKEQEENTKKKEDIEQLKEQNNIKDEHNEHNEHKSTQDIDNKVEEIEQNLVEKPQKGGSIKKKRPIKKSKFNRKFRGKVLKKVAHGQKRVTRAAATSPTKPKIKKPSRELLMLQEDIKEMFIRDDVLSSTGIRMCRLAKMVDDKNTLKEDVASEVEPVVVLEKFKDKAGKDTSNQEKPKRKKPGPKPKPKSLNDKSPDTDKTDKKLSVPNHKPGPKSKMKRKKNDRDPYAFESDSVDTNVEKESDEEDSDFENSSITSSKSFGSSECLADLKKKAKRKRRGWQAGVIKSKNKKKKGEIKVLNAQLDIPDDASVSETQIAIPDMNCFTDKTYCFRKNVTIYPCRLCVYTGSDIVHHYKNNHPHTEIPLSRMAPEEAKEAIEQCKVINYQAISKMPSDKYVCIFCYKAFTKKSKSALENLFWHIVITHTGEFKEMCSECEDISECPFNLDTPSPPKDAKGQLIGYICKKCNFTQISLENLKTHVIVRHNDEQTAVYTISLSVISRKAHKALLRHCNVPQQPRLLRSGRSNQSLTEVSDDQSDITETSSRLSESESLEQKPTDIERPSSPEAKPVSFQSKITFEGDDNIDDSDMNNEESDKVEVKMEKSEPTDMSDETPHNEEALNVDASETENTSIIEQEPTEQASDDIVAYPHFKIRFTDSGAKEYICCINGEDNHFKTTLLISMKKHVQIKHTENWDGYCFLCKVIVMPQGVHRFKDCFQHYLDKHMDSFPIFETEIVASTPDKLPNPVMQLESSASTKPLICVRPLSDLVSKADETPKDSSAFPVIESVVSLGATVEAPRPSPTYPTTRTEKQTIAEKTFKYEEIQADVMSKKHRVVLDAMMVKDKLIKVYKCAGRFCSFTTDSAEEALLHASTHQHIGGLDALNCSYCDFDAAGNAIDLVMHVFKAHGGCQYSCGECFYRAAASQLVGSHITRAHASSSACPVLRTTFVTTPTSESIMLTRAEAVSYYICTHKDKDGGCKFRSFIPEKFSDHLQQRHSSETSHPCNVCAVPFPSPAELLKHMKIHGLKLYQCTWCIHGADTESQLLAHVSSVHPSKQPQAYLRIITNKDGSNELRVLPLAFLNKSKVSTEDVVPRPSSEDPVREAERSIELEKLIGHANMIIESVNESIAAVTEPTIPPTDPQTDIASSSTITEDTNPPSNISDSSTSIEVPPAQLTPTRATTPPKDISLLKTPILKAEPMDAPAPTNDVVVLDSDEEDPIPGPGVIDLSDEETSTAQKQDVKLISPHLLNMCPKCRSTFKTLPGLKKHMFTCLQDATQVLICPHCKLVTNSKDDLMAHYKLVHREDKSNSYACGMCGMSLSSINLAKKHIKWVHKVKDFEIRSRVENGIVHYIAIDACQKTPPKAPPKRKASTGSSDASGPKRRYGPQDVDRLPINPILDQPVHCSLCEFSTKVRLNMVRHLQLHAQHQPAPNSAPVNPVPHLETNEKHFDKMVNLASSSIVTRRDEPAVALLIPAEAATRYPKYVPERQRLTCGARGCAYISVDEPMLRRHWDTLHRGSADYHCVHCPPYQHLDTSKPLTASRILAHLKMHDVALYACSSCSYYHYKREVLEKHLAEVHETGRMMVVREEASVPPPPSQPSSAPTMDLKPWQCGLCEFKSMLRPEVVEHCAKLHQSKMQFKCSYCPFRTSAVENITKHQTNTHPERPRDVFYYYYREGCVPDEPDGTPKWVKQRQKAGNTEPEIKTEAQVTPLESPVSTPLLAPIVTPSANPPSIDLSLVKKEVVEDTGPIDSIEGLCRRFGQFCEPNGLYFKCPLCKVVTEENKEAMQSHLYEELQYRKWGCGLCSYKGFHKTGLNEHMASEHRRLYQEPIELPTNVDIEKWVAALLDHQKDIIDKNRANLSKLKNCVEKPAPGPSKITPPPEVNIDKYNSKDLEKAFGAFGSPNNREFCCPKCSFTAKDEMTFKDHLENELTKIRWCCSYCFFNFSTYHEAQFHCKSHIGAGARPQEAARDPAMRSAWLSTVVNSQKQVIMSVPEASCTLQTDTSAPDNIESDENSLLVVRYEERVSTPEDTLAVRRKRPAPDSDDDDFIDEPAPKKKGEKACTHCDFTTKYNNALRDHMLRHYNLKPHTCAYCDFSSYRQGVVNHIEKYHPRQPIKVKNTELPADAVVCSPAPYTKKKSMDTDIDQPKLICLVCEKSVLESEVESHLHDKVKPDFARKGDVVVKCCICLALRIDVKALQEHHNSCHPDIPINYALFKLHYDTRETHYCGHCNKGFKYIRDLRSHHNAVHDTFQFMYRSSPYIPQSSDVIRRCARKSTTKLPDNRFVARKSTTKLPYSVPDDETEYSFYNTKPDPIEHYASVTTYIPLCNTMMPFTLKKLSEIIKIEPRVVVKDINSELSDG